MIWAVSAAGSEFQFTLPCRERQGSAGGAVEDLGFNSRSRVGSDPSPLNTCPSNASFNSRSRVGSDIAAPRPNRQEDVSIHAPV